MAYHGGANILLQLLLNADVDYTIYDDSPGKKEPGTGIPLEPDEPMTVEIKSITIPPMFSEGKDRLDILSYVPQDILDKVKEYILEDETANRGGFSQ